MRRFMLIALACLGLLMMGCKKESPFKGTDNRIVSFCLTTPDGEAYYGAIANDEVLITVPVATDVNEVTVSYKISEQATIHPIPTRITDWSSDQVFKVTSYSGESRTYTVKIRNEAVSEAGCIRLATQEDVTAFAKQGISHVGALVIGNAAGEDSISSIDALTSLTHVDYDVIINPTYKGKDLAGLRNLQEARSIIIKDNKYLKKVTLKSLKLLYQNLEVNSDHITTLDLPQLTHANGTISIVGKEITGIVVPVLESVGELYVEAANLSSLKLPALQQSKGNFSIKKCENLEILDLKQLTSVGRSIIIKQLSAMKSFSVPALKEVGGDFILSHCSELTEAIVPLLECVNTLNIEMNNKLETLYFPQLKETKYDLRLSKLPIRSLDNLPLERIGGSLYMEQLTTLNSLDNFTKKLTHIGKKVILKTVLVNGTLDFSHIANFSEENNNCQIELQWCTGFNEIILPPALHTFFYNGAPEKKLPQQFEVKGAKKINTMKIFHIVYDELRVLNILDLEEVSTLFVHTANVSAIQIPHLMKVTKFLKLDRAGLNLPDHFQGINVHAFESVDCPQLEEAETITLASPELKEVKMPALKSAGTLSIQYIKPVFWGPLQSQLEPLVPTENNALQNLSFPQLHEVKKITIQNMRLLKDYSFLEPLIKKDVLKKFTASNNGYNPTLDDLKAGKYTE